MTTNTKFLVSFLLCISPIIKGQLELVKQNKLAKGLSNLFFKDQLKLLLHQTRKGMKMSKCSNTMGKTDDLLTISRAPIIFWNLLAYIVALFLQFVNQIKFLESILFTSIFILYALIHWFSFKFKGTAIQYYLVFQGSLIFIAAFLLPKGALDYVM